MFKFPLRPSLPNPTTAIRSVSLLSTLFGATTTTQKMAEAPPLQMSVRSYSPKNPTGPLPYSQLDMTPMDPGNDASFYAPPRFVTHIDDNAIISLKRYYDAELLPKQHRGVILDFCSSWISHYPPRIFNAAVKRDEHRSRAESASAQSQSQSSSKDDGNDNASDEFIVLGTGMNQAELAANPVLKIFNVQNLNEDPEVSLPREQNLKLDASTCVVSIDYLTAPVDVLSSIRAQTVPGGSVHLAISNRCFPTKAVGRWLKVGEEQRLEMVGDYLWWAGWRDIEIVEVVKGGWITDPLWVVRAKNPNA